MKIFSAAFKPLQESILAGQAHRDQGNLCGGCNGTDANYRCGGSSDKCFDPELFCRSCIVQKHVTLPFHLIEEWNGKHFVRRSLRELGFILYLGHHGWRCPNLSSSQQPRPMTLVHTNGFHSHLVHFCHCQDAEKEAFQLARMELFPATIEQPETVFTFGLLRDYHKHTLSSKKSTHDYHKALVRLTSAAFPQDIPVSNVRVFS